MLRNVSNPESAVAAIVHRPRGTELLVARNFNTDLESLDEKKCDEAIKAGMSTEGLEDMDEQLIPNKIPWKQDGRTWIMIRHG